MIYSWGFINLILHVFWVYSSLIWEVEAFAVRTLERVTLVTQQKEHGEEPGFVTEMS